MSSFPHLRSKSGIWGWRSDKIESVNRYECKVFSASNVELVTKTRTEHLTDKDKQRCKKSSSRSPLESFLGIAEQEEKTQGASNGVMDPIPLGTQADSYRRGVQSLSLAGSSVDHQQSVPHHPRRVLQLQDRLGGQRHRASHRANAKDTEIQGSALAFGELPAVSAWASRSHHRSDGC